MLFAHKLKELRERNNLLQRQMSAALEIDTGLYSKYERGERIPRREQVVQMAEIFKIDKNELLTLWLADQVYVMVKDDDNAGRALNVVQENILGYGNGK